jgi:peptidoglycan/LPS O-acetylase OafA/YrhL
VQRLIFWTLFTVLLVCIGYTYFSLFMIGFWLFTVRDRLMRCDSAFYRILGLTMIATAIIVSSSVHPEAFIPPAAKINNFIGVALESPLFLQRELCAILLFLGVILLGPTRHWLEGKRLLWLGRISFSLYLIHFPILFTVKALAMHMSYGVAVLSTSAIMLPVTLAIAHYFEKFIDQGAIFLSRRIRKFREPAIMRSVER